MIENIGAYSQVDYDRGYSDAIKECLKIAKNNETMWDGGSWTVREIEQLKENKND